MSTRRLQRRSLNPSATRNFRVSGSSRLHAWRHRDHLRGASLLNPYNSHRLAGGMPTRRTSAKSDGTNRPSGRTNETYTIQVEAPCQRDRSGSRLIAPRRPRLYESRWASRGHTRRCGLTVKCVNGEIKLRMSVKVGDPKAVGNSHQLGN